MTDNSDDAGDPGSLRYAISQVDSYGTGSDSIAFALPAGGKTITLGSALPQITNNVSIDGGGVVTLSGNSLYQVLNIGPTATVTLSGLTITNGHSGYSGGGIQNQGDLTVSGCVVSNSYGDGGGGGIDNSSGKLKIFNSTIIGNSGYSAGGIYSAGSLTIVGSAIVDNVSIYDIGGGLLNLTGTVAIADSTIAGNSADNAAGGGIASNDTLVITNCTISGNSAGGDGGIFNNGGTVKVGNTLIAGNTASSSPDVGGVFTSQGYNLIGKTDGSSGWTGSDLKGTAAAPLDPKLGPLAPNGGPTETMALLVGSPAIDHGDNALAVDAQGNPLTTDQRGAGFPRIVHGTVDIGAFEAQAGALALGAAGFNVNENAGSVNIPVTRGGGASGAVSVVVSTSDGTALAGVDYAPVTQTLSWADGDTATKYVTVPIHDRGLTSGTSTFSVALSAPGGGAVLASPSGAGVQIAETDSPPSSNSGIGFGLTGPGDSSPGAGVGTAAGIPGGTVSVPVVVTDATGLNSLTFTVHYDPTALAISSSGVLTGELTGGWVVSATVDAAAGTVICQVSNPDPNNLPVPGAQGSVAMLQFSVKPGAAAGGSTLTISDGVGNAGAVTYTSQSTEPIAQGGSGVVVSSQPFEVTSSSATTSGFVVYLNDTPDFSKLDLSAFTLAGAGGNSVSGSLAWDPSSQGLTFVSTGGPLPADQYTVTLHGVVDPSGNALAGDGTHPGSDFVAHFTVSALPAGTRTVSLPTFARGPGQGVNVPNTASGLPVRIDDGAGVTKVSLTLTYNALMLCFPATTSSPTAAALGLPPGWTVTSYNNYVYAGQSGPTQSQVTVGVKGPALPSGPSNLLALPASVPSGAPYLAGDLLEIANVALNAGQLPVRQQVDSLHKVVYFGDAGGAGRLTSQSASVVLGEVAGESGVGSKVSLVSPLVVGDVDGSGTLTSQDALSILGAVVGDPQSSALIPAIPSPISVPPGGVDPKLSVTPATQGGAPGGSVVVTLNIDAAAGLDAADLGLKFDPTVFAVSKSDVKLGSLTTGWLLASTVTGGELKAAMSTDPGSALSGGAGELLEVTLHVLAGAQPGSYALTLDGSFSDLNGGGLALTLSNGVVVLPTPVGAVSGEVYGDANGNGTLDPGESGLSGVTVYVDSNGDGTLEGGEPSAVTDGAGDYTIGGLSSGVYTLRQVVPSGFTQTAPGGPGGLSVTVSAGATTSGENFGDAPVQHGTIALGQNAFSVSESGGTVVVSLTRTGGSTGTASVRLGTSDGTAVAGVDYTAVDQTVTWADGDASTKTVAIPIIDRGLNGGSKTVNLTLASFVGATQGTPATAVLTINDDDPAGTLQFAVTALQVQDDVASASVTVTRTGGTAGTVTVVCSTAGGTAQAGLDYTTESTTLTFPAGSSAPQTFTVPILHDPGLTGAVTVDLNLSAPQGGASLGPASTAVLTITPAPTLQVTGISPSASFLPSLPGNQVVVTFNHELAGLTPDRADGSGFAANPFAVMLVPSGPDDASALGTGQPLWSAPTGVDGGDLPIPATLVYHKNGDGTSTITLTPRLPLATDVYLIVVNGLTDTGGGPLVGPGGVPGNVYSSFDYRPSTSLAAPRVTAVTAYNGAVAVADHQIPQPDTIGVRFSEPMDMYTINATTVQLFAQGVAAPLPAAVVYSPTTQTAYLTPETLLIPGAVYFVSVDRSVTSDVGFPSPGVPLGQTYYASFTVAASTAVLSSPLSVLGTSPADGTLWGAPLGYVSVGFSEPLGTDLTTSLAGRFSVMLISQTGGATTGGSGFADVPLNAKLAFNPNTNQLVIVPTQALGNDVVYLVSLHGITAKGSALTPPVVYSTFLLNNPGPFAAERAGASALEAVALPPSTGAPAGPVGRVGPAVPAATVQAARSYHVTVAPRIRTARPVQSSGRRAPHWPSGPLSLWSS